MLESLATWGLPGLFAVAFVAGSIFAAPSEVVLAGAIAAGHSPYVSVVVATVGNVLGAATLFALTRYAARKAEGRLQRWLSRRSEGQRERLERGHGWFRRYGSPVLLLSWLPVIGDALVLVAGALRIGWLPFAVFVTLGKGARYALVAAAAVGALA